MQCQANQSIDDDLDDDSDSADDNDDDDDDGVVIDMAMAKMSLGFQGFGSKSSDSVRR